MRLIRKERGISQEQLALESGLDRTYVSLIERGVQSPTLRTVTKLAGVLKMKPSEMIIRMELVWGEVAGQVKGGRLPRTESVPTPAKKARQKGKGS